MGRRLYASCLFYIFSKGGFELDGLRTREYLPMVYICSPYSGDTEQNTLRARKYSRFAYERRNIPMTPHLLFPQFMSDDVPAERADAMHFNYVLLGACDELWVFGEKVSEGMAHEIGIAKKQNLPIRYFTEGLEEVKRDD